MNVSTDKSAAIYAACLAAAQSMSGDLKRLSWFGKNHVRAQQALAA